MDTKTCTVCEVEKPINDYSKYRNKCKECTKQIKRDYYANNKEKWSIYYTNNKDKIIDKKENGIYK